MSSDSRQAASRVSARNERAAPNRGRKGFSWPTADDSAAAGSDYVANSGTLNFAGTAGETQTVTVAVTGEEIVELNETFFVDLSNAQGSGRTLGISDAQGLGTITNDDTGATVSVADATIPEGGNAVFTVSLSAPSDADVLVNYATSDGTALVGDSDYTSASGTLTIRPSRRTRAMFFIICCNAARLASALAS